MTTFDPRALPLSDDEIEALRIRAANERTEAVRLARNASLHGDDAAALEVHRAWKPISSKR